MEIVVLNFYVSLKESRTLLENFHSLILVLFGILALLVTMVDTFVFVMLKRWSVVQSALRYDLVALTSFRQRLLTLI